MAKRTAIAPAGEGGGSAGESKSPASAAPSEDLESLRSQVKISNEERDQYLALLQRTRADFENYQKRKERDLAQERRYALAPFARELLPVLDNLQRALESARVAEKTPLAEGVNLLSQLLDTCERFGITPADALGQPFDPNLHESVGERSVADVDPGTVVEIRQPGYRMHDRVLRPPQVIVAAEPMPGPVVTSTVNRAS